MSKVDTGQHRSAKRVLSVMTEAAHRLLRTVAVCLLLPSSWGCREAMEEPPPPPPPPLEALVKAKVLAQRLRTGPRPMIVDSRRNADYLEARVATSLSLPLSAVRLDGSGALDRKTLDEINLQLASSGLQSKHIIVAVDEAGPVGFSRAATTCWLLATAGAGHCLILEGGIEAWFQARGPTERGEPEEKKLSSDLRIRQRPPQVADLDEIRRVTVESGGTVVDVRTAALERTIPGAVRAPILEAVRPDGRIDTAAARRIALESGLLLDAELIAVGESLEDGAAGWYLISRVLGIGYTRLFPGGFTTLRTYSNIPMVERPLTADFLVGRGLDAEQDRP